MIASLRFLAAALRDLATLTLVGVIRCYQLTLSPLVGRQCRFEPTCSVYAVLAIRRYGPLRGSLKTVWRLLRCHPWGGGGPDPP